jgi:hypothetical protein
VRLHPSVARVILEAVGETKIVVNVYAQNPTGAGGFFPERNHPNLDITFVAATKGKHLALNKAREVHVQFGGEHFGGELNQGEYAKKKGCLIISAIGNKKAGRYTAMVLDYLAKNSGRLVGDGYFSWQGSAAGAGGDIEKTLSWFFTKMTNLFGVPGLRHPDPKREADLFRAAGLSTEEVQPEPELIKGKPELNPAAKVLATAGMDFEQKRNMPFQLDKIPTDLAHQHILQRALDELKDAGILDYDVSYDKSGKINGVSVLKEGVDSDMEVAIISGMKNSDLISKRSTGPLGMPGYEVAFKGVNFFYEQYADGDGTIMVIDDGIYRVVAEFEDGKIADKIRALADKINAKGIMEAVYDHCGKPING